MNSYAQTIIQDRAKMHTLQMQEKYSSYTAASVMNSKIYHKDSRFLIPKPWIGTRMEVINEYPENAIEGAIRSTPDNGRNKVGLLNTASFSCPGGQFWFGGCSSTEEHICHSSNLFNIIGDKAFRDFYKYNKNNPDNIEAENRAIFTPTVIVNNKYRCDVLSCYPPKPSEGLRIGKRGKHQRKNILEKRARFLLSCFAENACSIIIMDLFGLNNGFAPEEIADVFAGLIEGDFYGCFKKVVFATKGVDESRVAKFKNSIGQWM